MTGAWIAPPRLDSIHRLPADQRTEPLALLGQRSQSSEVRGWIVKEDKKLVFAQPAARNTPRPGCQRDSFCQRHAEANSAGEHLLRTSHDAVAAARVASMENQP